MSPSVNLFGLASTSALLVDKRPLAKDRPG